MGELVCGLQARYVLPNAAAPARPMDDLQVLSGNIAGSARGKRQYRSSVLGRGFNRPPVHLITLSATTAIEFHAKRLTGHRQVGGP